MKLLLTLILVLAGSQAIARADDNPTFVFPTTEGAGTGFAEIVAPGPSSNAITTNSLDSAGNSITGFGGVATGSSSLSTGGVASGVPDAGFTAGSSVTPNSPSSVPSDF